MSDPTPMSRDDLLDLASLDAYGLLDDYEAALFTRSFHHAPVAVQDEVRLLQAEFAGDDMLLPDVTPDASLKTRVLRTVATAIEEESVELAPLATIGRRRRAQRDSIGRIGRTSNATYWRAASLVLAAVAVLFAYFGAQARSRNHLLVDHLVNAASADQVEELYGRDFMSIAGNPNTRRVVLRNAPNTRFDGTAYVFVLETEAGRDADTITSFLRTDFLDDDTYMLTARSADGNVMMDRQFTAAGGVSTYVSLTMDRHVANGLSSLTWEITNAAGQLVLTSAV